MRRGGLRHEQPTLTTAFSGAPDAVIECAAAAGGRGRADGKIVDANVAAEAFFEVSVPLLKRHLLRELIPFGSPLLSLVDQVRERGGAVNEYRVDLSARRAIPASTSSISMSHRCRSAPAMSS